MEDDGSLENKDKDMAVEERHKILELLKTPENQQNYSNFCGKIMQKSKKLLDMSVLAVLEQLKI